MVARGVGGEQAGSGEAGGEGDTDAENDREKEAEAEVDALACTLTDAEIDPEPLPLLLRVTEMLPVSDDELETLVVTDRLVDGAWRLTFCNERVGKLVGKSASLQKLPFWDLFPDEKRKGRKAKCVKEVEAGRSVVVEDYHSRYGRWFEMRFSRRPAAPVCSCAT